MRRIIRYLWTKLKLLRSIAALQSLVSSWANIKVIPRDEHDALVNQLNKHTCELAEERDLINRELNNYKMFVNSIFYYAGNYPAWKAQQELRQIVTFPFETSQSPDKLYSGDIIGNKVHIYTLDRYLGRLVDSLGTLINLHPNNFNREDNKSFSEDFLPAARGDQYLPRFREKIRGIEKHINH